MTRFRLMSTIAIFMGAGCGEEPGTIEVTAYGEAFIEEGIPAATFSDGWALTFDRFLVSLAQVHSMAGHGAPALSDARIQVFDLARPSMGKGFVVTSGVVPGGRYDHVGYTVTPALAGAAAGSSGVPEGALAAMIAAGESLRVEGRAQKGSAAVSFAWGFRAAVEHLCHAGLEVDGGTATSQITIHGDHLFYDDLFAAEPLVAFELVAASDADADGAVTPAELAARDISSQARYQVGSTGIRNLWDFIAHQATTVGHIDGEGHCETAVR